MDGGDGDGTGAGSCEGGVTWRGADNGGGVGWTREPIGRSIQRGRIARTSKSFLWLQLRRDSERGSSSL